MNYTAPDKGRGDKFSYDEHNQLKAAVNSKAEGTPFMGDAAISTNPGIPSSPVYYYAPVAGTYTNFKDSGNSPIVVTAGDLTNNKVRLSISGAITTKVLEPSTIVILAADLTVNDATKATKASDSYTLKGQLDANTSKFNNFSPIESKKFNYLSNANELSSEWSAVSNAHSVFSYNLINSTEPFPFPKPPIKITLTPTGTNESAFITKEIAVIPADRIYIGGWFYMPFFANSGLNTAGFYITEIITNTPGYVTHGGTTLTNSQMVVGHSHSSGNFTTKVVAIQGDWAFVVTYNNANFDSSVLRVQINLFMLLTGTPSSVTMYVNNLTFLKNQGDILPFAVYDNSAFSAAQIQANQASISNIQATVNALPTIDTTAAAAAKTRQVNPLNDGNFTDYFWSKTPANAGLYIEDNLASHNPGRLVSPRFQVTSVTRANVWFYKTFAIKPTDNFIVGFWYKNTDTVPGTLGFYIQVFGTDQGSPLQNAKHDFTNSQLSVQGTVLNNAFVESKVLIISGAWTYIQCRNVAAINAGALTVTVNIYQDGLTNGMSTNIHFDSITFLYDTQINPYINYDNRGILVGSGEKWVLDGDSIIAQDVITRALRRLTGATIDYSLALSGSGYTSTSGLTTPSMTSTTRADAIAAKSPDVIILEGGVNDWRLNAILGTLAEALGGGTDYNKFYNAVYKRLSTISSQNPFATILVLTPYQDFYGTETPDVANTNGNYQSDFADAIIAVAKALSIPCLDWYRESGINKFTKAVRLNDGLHPASDSQGYPLAKQIVGKIKSLKN